MHTMKTSFTQVRTPHPDLSRTVLGDEQNVYTHYKSHLSQTPNPYAHRPAKLSAQLPATPYGANLFSNPFKVASKVMHGYMPTFASVREQPPNLHTDMLPYSLDGSTLQLKAFSSSHQSPLKIGEQLQLTFSAAHATVGARKVPYSYKRWDTTVAHLHLGFDPVVTFEMRAKSPSLGTADSSWGFFNYVLASAASQNSSLYAQHLIPL